MTIDRDPVCSKMIRVSDEVHDMLCDAKIIPQEPYNECLKRIVAENNYLKRHYIAEAPRASMERDLHNFVLNTEIPDCFGSGVNESHLLIWSKIHPEDPLKEDELIHHINGNHDDNRPENLLKIKKRDHWKYHKELNTSQNVNKYGGGHSNIATVVPEKFL